MSPQKPTRKPFIALGTLLLALAMVVTVAPSSTMANTIGSSGVLPQTSIQVETSMASGVVDQVRLDEGAQSMPDSSAEASVASEQTVSEPVQEGSMAPDSAVASMPQEPAQAPAGMPANFGGQNVLDASSTIGDVNSEAALRQALLDALVHETTTIELTDSFLIQDAVEIPADKHIVLTSAAPGSHTITAGASMPYMISLQAAGGAFTLGNAKLDGDGASGVIFATGDTAVTIAGGIVTGGKNVGVNNTGGVYCGPGSSFLMSSGSITGNNTGRNGGGLYVDGQATLAGGGITANRCSAYGAGVYVSAAGSFRMDGGDISLNNSANSGGGIFTESGNVAILGGRIEGNEAGSGGGVYVKSAAGTSVEINNNVEINGNVATNGGGVYLHTGGVALGATATIALNRANSNGGGVYVYSGNFTSAGTIAGNQAASGGGVYVNTNGRFHMSAGGISTNQATSYGGGIYIYGSNFANHGNVTTSGGGFSGNTAGLPAGHYYGFDVNSHAALAATHDSSIQNLESLSSPFVWDPGAADRTMTMAYNNQDIYYFSNIPMVAVVYHPNVGGSYIQCARNGFAAATPQDTNSTGYTSIGWYDDPDGGNLWDFRAGIYAETHLYERQVKVLYTAYFYDSENHASEVQTRNYYYDDTLDEMSPTINPSDRSFDGWQVRGQSRVWDFENDTMPAGDLHLVAVWKPATSEPPVDSTPSSSPSSSRVQSSEGPSSTAPSSENAQSSSAVQSSSAAPESTGQGGGTAQSSTPAVSSSRPARPSSTRPGSSGPSSGASAPEGSAAVSEHAQPAQSTPQGSAAPQNDSAADAELLQEDTATMSLFGNELPLGGLASESGWSLFNLVLGVLALLVSLLTMLSHLLARRRQARTAREDAAFLQPADVQGSARFGSLLVWITAGLGLVPILCFSLLENFARMQMFSRWTPLIAALLLVQLGLAVAGRVTSRTKRRRGMR